MKTRTDDLSIVAIGGGTGLSSILAACSAVTSDITAIVSVADNGGCSGRLRQDFNIPPPGDIRNCLESLAQNIEMKRLFNYRFTQGSCLAGRSLGNLIITALWDMRGDFSSAIKAAAALLDAKGRVLPVTDSNITIGAICEDGTRIEGQVEIIAHRGSIKELYIQPEKVEVLPEAIAALGQADMIILGPGSLYTSVIATLITGGLYHHVMASNAKVIYLMNAMTQPGETDGYLASDHLRAIARHTFTDLIDIAVVSKTDLADSTITAYAGQGASLVENDLDLIGCPGPTVLERDLLTQAIPVRHESKKLESLLAEILCLLIQK